MSGFAEAATVNVFFALIATPILLWIAGALTLVMIGFAISTVFGFIVGIPMLIANQIFAFERSLQIYRFKSNSLAGRIPRVFL